MEGDIDAYLQAEAAAGQLESSGSFQVDLGSALAKLGAYQLGLAGGAWLKAVQAMVGLDCQSMELVLRKDRGLLQARFGALPPSLESLLEHPDLQMALRSAGGESVFLERQEEGLATRVHLGGELTRWEVPRARGFWLRVGARGGRPHAAQEAEEVRARTRYCPVPLRLNGKSVAVTDWAWKLPSRPSRDLDAPPGYFLVERYLVDGPLGPAGLRYLPRGRSFLETPTRQPSFRGGGSVPMLGTTVVPDRVSAFLSERIFLSVDPGRLWSGDKVPGSKPFERVAPQVPTCRGWLAITAHLDTPSRVDVVQNGVLLEPIHGPFHLPGCLAVLSGDNLQVDLSQFRVRENEIRSAELGAVQFHWREMWLNLRANLDKFCYPTSQGGMAGMGAVLGGGMGLMTLHPAGMVLMSRLGRWIGGTLERSWQGQKPARQLRQWMERVGEAECPILRSSWGGGV